MPTYHYRPRDTDQAFSYKFEADSLDAAIKFLAKTKDLSVKDFKKIYEVQPTLDKEMKDFVDLANEYDSIQAEAHEISSHINMYSQKLEDLLTKLKQLREQENELYTNLSNIYNMPVKNIKKALTEKLMQ